MNYLGHLGPLIDYFRKKGDRIVLLCDNTQAPKSCGYKAYQYPHVEDIHSIFGRDDTRAFHTANEFAEMIIDTQLRVVFFLAINPIIKEAKDFLAEKKIDIIFAHLQAGGDIFSATDISCVDVVYLFSESCKDLWKEWVVKLGLLPTNVQGPLFKQIDTKAVISGFSQVEQVATFDRLSICEKYGIPKDKKVVVYLPFPWRVPFCKWSHILYKPQNKILKIARLLLRGDFASIPKVFNTVDDKQVAQTLRDFCDRNNAFFVVKGRAKNKIPPYLKSIADRVILDESYYPYTIMELLYVADLCIHFYSDAIKESSALSVPNICLGARDPKDWKCCAPRFSVSAYSFRAGSYYNFESVVYNESVDGFVKTFFRKSFDDYEMNPDKRNDFIEKFLGYCDFNSCGRIYEDICKRLK
ncbi:MAG: CDP-glycerol glycerophosphotransferase family protein [Anaerohalosphaeraceae bacterium]|nr:CDP-glycerol glycerophosphotransferase family protein [Anaerohalosphaeraceae bacterium]